jgi:hypothetical protein
MSSNPAPSLYIIPRPSKLGQYPSPTKVIFLSLFSGSKVDCLTDQLLSAYSFMWCEAVYSLNNLAVKMDLFGVFGFCTRGCSAR